MTPATKAFDTRKVAGIDSTGTHVLHTYSNLNATGHYVQHSLSPSNAAIGQTITIKFIGKETPFKAVSGGRPPLRVGHMAVICRGAGGC